VFSDCLVKEKIELEAGTLQLKKEQQQQQQQQQSASKRPINLYNKVIRQDYFLDNILFLSIIMEIVKRHRYRRFHRLRSKKIIILQYLSNRIIIK